jgi:hypothetical protein
MEEIQNTRWSGQSMWTEWSNTGCCIKCWPIKLTAIIHCESQKKKKAGHGIE